MNEIWKRVKELRISHNMTQTDVANALGVTTQAVSRWESQATLPDIAQLVPMADFFGVTTDYLLGHDIAKKENEILNHLKSCQTAAIYLNNSKLDEMIDKTRALLRKYPSDHRLMLELCSELFFAYKKYKADSQCLEEILEWGDVIMTHSIDDSLRYQASKWMIYAYHELGMYENVKRIVNSLPDLSESNDAMQYFCAPPGSSEALQNEKAFAYKCFDNVCATMLRYGANAETQLFTTKEKISICQTVADMVRAYYPKGDYDGFSLEYLYRAELYIALFFAMEDNEEKALAALKSALLSFEKINTISSIVLKNAFVSPFLTGLTAPHGSTKERYKKLFLSVTEHTSFQKIKNEEAFKTIEKRFLQLAE